MSYRLLLPAIVCLVVASTAVVAADAKKGSHGGVTAANAAGTDPSTATETASSVATNERDIWQESPSSSVRSVVGWVTVTGS